MPAHNWFLRLLAVAGLAVVLLWPAIVNGGPFYFPDTRTYIRVADAAVNKLTHKSTIWTAAPGEAPNSKPSPPAFSSNRDPSASGLPTVLAVPNSLSRTRSLETIKQRGFMLGRSLYYGLLLYLGAISGDFWLTLLAQACALLLAIYLLLRSLDCPVWPHLAIITIALSILSNVAFFTSFLMPDIFAGIVVLLSAVLISIRRALTPAEYLPFYLLLAAGMLFHDSCGLISICLIGGAIIVNLVTRSWTNWRGLCVIFLAVITGLVGQQLFASGVKRTMGEAPMRYPFLSARLIADGPGTVYLRNNCPASGFMLCQYVKEFPLNSQDFLFGTEPGKTLFATASHDDRLAISKEQFRFLIAVFKSNPLAVLKTSIDNSIAELFDFTFDEFHFGPDRAKQMDRNLPVETLSRLHKTAAYRNTVPIKALNRIVYAFVAASILYLLLAVFGALPERRMDRNQKHLFYWIVFGLVVNAAICGTLSGVFPRYEARVIWLLPLLAILIESHIWLDQSRKTPVAGSKTAHLHA